VTCQTWVPPIAPKIAASRHLVLIGGRWRGWDVPVARMSLRGGGFRVALGLSGLVRPLSAVPAVGRGPRAKLRPGL
jgi:hypothetical protein